MNIIMPKGLKKILNCFFLLILLLIIFFFSKPSSADVIGCPCITYDIDHLYRTGLEAYQREDYLTAFLNFSKWSACSQCRHDLDESFLNDVLVKTGELHVILTDYIKRGKQSLTTIHTQTGGGVRGITSAGKRMPEFPPAVIRK